MTPTKTCLDAETLAAWVDGGLDARAAAMAEAHVSSCPRCQEIAGLIMKTMPVEPARATFWSGFRAGWLIPLTAGVAAVGLWMIVPSDRTTAPPTPTAISATRVAQAPAAEQAKKPADELKEFAPVAPAEEFRAKEKAQGEPALARDRSAKNEAAASAKAAAGQAQQLAKDSDAKRFDEAKADTLADANANKLRAQETPAVAPAPPAPTAPRPAAMAAAPPASASEAGRLEAQAPARQSFGQAAATREATSRDGSIRWRLTSTNTLERSADNGSTWVPVETGAGGPLASIQATDANTATVTTVDGRQFRTIDSGKTWRVFP